MVAVFALPAVAAFNFQEPTDWTVGDPGSTYQNWQASLIAPFAATNSPATNLNVNPTISTPPNMGVQTPGFVPSSGGYYSFSGDYLISGNIYNHGGVSATTSDYLIGFGTSVRVQTSSTTNPELDFSVFQDSIKLVKLDGTPIDGGANSDLIAVTQIFLQEVDTPGFGVTDRQELLFEFFLPEYSGDFKVQFEMAVHSSFQDLRVDTMLVADQSAIPGDFDGDGDVDGRDFLAWQRGGSPTPGSTDDLEDWQTNYGLGELSALHIPLSTFLVPEPTSLLVVIFGIITGLTFRISPRAGSR